MDEITKTINNILETENAKSLKNDDDLLTSSELDSFGYAVLWIEMNEKYKCFDVDYVDTIDYDTFSIGDIKRRITQCS